MNLPLTRLGNASSLFLAILLFSGCSSVKSTALKTAPPQAPVTPPTHTVTRAASKPKVQLDAVFQAVEMAPVKLEAKTWTDLTVREAVPHGAGVKKGDVLVKLDLDKLNEQIEEMELERPAAALALQLAEAELDNLQKTAEPKLEAARRAQRIAGEDLAYFETTSRAQKEKAAEFNVKSAEQRLDGAQEELKQLEKMYKADDLTEDTEEIILRRQKFAVESAQYSLDVAKQNTALALKTSIPREHEALKAQKRDQDQAFAYAEYTSPRNLAKKQHEVEKLKRDQKKTEKKLADLKKDLESLIVRAPMDGVVYYGACEAGKWTTGAAIAKKLVPNGKLAVNEIFMTVVNPDKLELTGVVQESELAPFKPGLEGHASPIAAPTQQLPVKLEQLGIIPLPTGGFEARFSVAKTAGLGLMPGMNCKLALGATNKLDGLVVPKQAVFGEDSAHHVFLLNADGKPKKRAVKLGESDGPMVVILEGLAEGDKILLARPD